VSTQVLFFRFGKTKFIEYKPEKHGSKPLKFLVWTKTDDSLLILTAGKICKDCIFLLNYGPKLLSKQYPALFENKPTGGGTCKKGKIKKWHSSSCSVETSEKIKSVILEALNVVDKS
jgi:hypothetical protein